MRARARVCKRSVYALSTIVKLKTTGESANDSHDERLLRDRPSYGRVRRASRGAINVPSTIVYNNNSYTVPLGHFFFFYVFFIQIRPFVLALRRRI